MRIAHLLAQAIALFLLSSSAFAILAPAASDAAATPDNRVLRATHALDRRAPKPPALPSIERIMAELSVAPNTSLVYSGVYLARTLEPAKQRLRPYRVVNDHFRRPAFSKQWEAWPEHNDEFWRRASAAFARLSAGHVLVVLPYGKPWRSDSVWELYERPVLLTNPRVTKVEAVYDDPAHTRQTIWDAAKRAGIMLDPRRRLQGSNAA
jgi:hypothetical protein